MADIDDVVREANRRFRRSVVRVETDLQLATAAFTLGCGHTTTIEIASHPVASIGDLSIEPGDEMTCSQCGYEPKYMGPGTIGGLPCDVWLVPPDFIAPRPADGD